MNELFDSYVVLLLHFDGADGNTADIDYSGRNHTIVFHGGAQLDTGQKIFNPTSLLLDGSGDYLSIASTSDFAFGTADFTIDFWLRYEEASLAPYIFDCRIGGVNAVVPLIHLQSADNYKPTYYVDGANRIVSSVGLTINTWYHLAIVKYSGTTTMYIDGVNRGSFVDSFNYIACPMIIGDYSIPGSLELTGHLDEFRVSKGVARWTANFTPPPYPYYRIAKSQWF